jgi:hypothetical protein
MALMTGVAAVATLANAKAELAASAATRSFTMLIPCCRSSGFYLSCPAMRGSGITQLGYLI